MNREVVKRLNLLQRELTEIISVLNYTVQGGGDTNTTYEESVEVMNSIINEYVIKLRDLGRRYRKMIYESTPTTVEYSSEWEVVSKPAISTSREDIFN